MRQGVFDILAVDHDRLDGLLRQATAVPGLIDRNAYDAFRSGLLRHIAMEERILFPALLSQGAKEQSAIVERLHLDHAAIAALLVPSPSASIVSSLLSILEGHNAMEETDGGVYRLLDRLPDVELERVVGRLKATPEVPVAPYNDKPGVLEATRRALARAGFFMKDP